MVIEGGLRSDQQIGTGLIGHVDDGVTLVLPMHLGELLGRPCVGVALVVVVHQLSQVDLTFQLFGASQLGGCVVGG